MILPKGLEQEKLAAFQEIVKGYWGGNPNNYQLGISQNPKQLTYIQITREEAGIAKALVIALYTNRENISAEKPLIDGSAMGKKWDAGIELNDVKTQIFLIVYEGGLEEIATPGRIPNILSKLEKIAEKERKKTLTKRPKRDKEIYKNPIWAGLPMAGAKGYTIISTADKEENAEKWEARHNSGLDSSQNRLIENKLKGSKAYVIYNEKKHEIDLENLAYPSNKIALMGLVNTLFSNTAYSVIFALGVLQAMAGKRIFYVKVSDICKIISGPNYAGRDKQKVIETIYANSKIDMVLDEPTGKKQERNKQYFTPISIHEEFYNPGKLPHAFKLELFHQLQDDDFTGVALPENVFSLEKPNYKLAYMLWLYTMHYNGSEMMKIEEPIIMEAAGLGKAYNANKSVARKRLKEKLLQTEKAGIHGPFERIENGYALIRQINGPESPQIPSIV